MYNWSKRMPIVPSLFRLKTKTEAIRLYSLYLARLDAAARERRILEACRAIRNYAVRDKRPRWADFTYGFEVEALCKLGRYSDAWRQVRRLERIVHGPNIDLRADAWKPGELNWFFNYHPQILYFLHRYKLASRLLEALLEKLVTRRREGMSYEILWFVYKPIARPRSRHEVTLYHLYQRLGKSLVEWPEWEQFVKGFHPKLFRLAGISEEDLLRDPSLLRTFYNAITEERNRRLTANVSVGESELVDPVTKVHRHQQSIDRKRSLQDPVIRKRNQQLEEIFPELGHLS
jgi:hypothetical protein